jgi:hypothetical protein
MKDTLEIIHDKAFPRYHIANGAVTLAPTYHAKLNGIPMDLGDAVTAYVENEENPPLKLPHIPGWRFGNLTKLKSHSCPYCRSLHSLQRCPSCGAPRTAEKPKETELYRAWGECANAFAEWRGVR